MSFQRCELDYKKIVRDGYNKVSHEYYGDSSCDLNKGSIEWVKEIMDRFPAGSRALDLGCGCGMPATRLLAEKFEVTGVDISEVQIERAREYVPNVKFIQADIAEYNLLEENFDIIVSFYTIIHIPLEEQFDLFKRIAGALKPGGLFMAIVGYTAWTGTEVNWLGVEGATMFWSHEDRDTYIKWITDAGLFIEWDRFIPEGDSGHTLILAHKP